MTTSPSAVRDQHPSLADWDAYRRGPQYTHELLTPATTLAAHLERCASCRELVARLEALTAALECDADAAPPGLWSRIAASRASGDRVLLPGQPIDDEDGLDAASMPRDVARSLPSPRAPHRAARRTLLAAGLAAVAALALFRRTPVAEAGIIAGTMTLSPAMPKPGEAVDVRYAAGALFGRPSTLRLRARVRTASASDETGGITVTTLGTLTRTEGNEYRGHFRLPDSIVFAALVVEDTAARAVDDFGGRTWEVLRSTSAGQPSLAALHQRAEDLMGRGWEAGLANVRRMVALYPDSLEAWSWLASFENWMSLANDSTKAVHRTQAARLEQLYTTHGLVHPEKIGRFFWYTRQLDTAANTRWAARLLRAAPTNEFAIQERMLRAMRRAWETGDSVGALAALEAMWPEVPRSRQGQVAGEALSLIPKTDANAVAVQRWLTRAQGESPTIGQDRSAGRVYLRIPSLQRVALAKLRRAAERSTNPAEFTRALTETADAFGRRQFRSRALSDAALGQALATVGERAQAIDILRRAADAAWDPEVFTALANASMAAGDTAFALPHLARVAVDPRTAAERKRSVDALGRARLGAAGWDTMLATQRAELSRRVLAEARPRHVDDVTLPDLQNRTTTLYQLGGGKPLLVVFWSPNCGPAVDALPAIEALGKDLAARGLPMITIVEQPRRDRALDETIARTRFTRPVYLDAGGKASAAFNNWGTPQLYLVDGRGRVQFAPTSDVDEVRVQAEAMLAAKD
ncbi:MAG: redoxin domain-containing protein [Gemmatimonadaceae bacterium]|nr:redoxin domain-containing protein [Gemmatimonadaceae bacterium]